MSSTCQFADDIEFTKLIGFQRAVSTTQAALELARDARPQLDVAVTKLQLDALADEARGTIIRHRNDVKSLEAFCQIMSETNRFGGSSECFEQADSSYLDRVVETRRGIPISLSMVYVAVAERLGLPLTGVAAPAHFLCRFESDQGPLFVDAFNGGKILTELQCIRWIGEVSGLGPEEVRPALQSANPRTIILRMLNNLKALHLRKNQWRRAERVLERLLALRPASFVDRRDLASVSMMRARPGRVLDLFDGSQSHLEPEERQSVEQLVASARQMLARCN